MANIIKINSEGLEEEIRCSLCRNPIKTDRGCDGGCIVDEKIVTTISDIILKRIEKDC